ncbi:MAG: CHAP domain-containing protein [Candidatus Dormibacteraeota bacterium]|nr:CHAP domain-containing protein [Candidatus Dormibacteraeota bacterium]
MKRKLLFFVALPGAALLGLQAMFMFSGAGASPAVQGGQVAASQLAQQSIPSAYMAAYQHAAALCPGLSWTVLAGIGQVETGQGEGGKNPAQTSPAGAQGPMQFMPSTFAAYHLPGEDDINNIQDAADAAAHYLCSNGGGNASTLSQAIFQYNHLQSYVDDVLSWAGKYAATGAVATVQVTAGAQPGGGAGPGQSITVEPQTPVTSGAPFPTTGFPFGQCTWWVALNHPVTWSGNAWQWWQNSPASQHRSSPAPGEIVVYGPGHGYSSFGHVALIIAVNPGGYVVSEMNYLSVAVVDQRQAPWPDAAVEGFIA